MREYSIALPIRSNSGADYHLERVRWEIAALELAGGFTRDAEPAHGSWKGPQGIYREEMQGYKVATDRKTFGRLLELAFALFPDQVAFYTVEGGAVAIPARNELENHNAIFGAIEPEPAPSKGPRFLGRNASASPVWQSFKSALGIV